MKRPRRSLRELLAAAFPSVSYLWPLAGLLFLSGNMLHVMVSHPYSFFNDDITHLFALNQYINDGVLASPFHGTTFDAIIVVLGLKALYIPVLIFFTAIGSAYPFIAASKFWGFAAIPLSFFVWSRYLSVPLGRAFAHWGALAITAYSVMNEIIPAGLARSFNVALLGIWLLALRNRSLWQINAVLVVTSLVYPVVLPVMGLSLFLAVAWTWRGQESPWRRFLLLATGFVSAIGYFLLRGWLDPILRTQEFLGYAQLLERCQKFVCSGTWFEVEKMSGRLAGQNPFQWIHFNVFSAWSSISTRGGCLVIAFLVLVVLAGIARRRSRAGENSSLPRAAALAASVLGAALVWDSTEPMAAVSWWLVLSGAAWFAFGAKRAFAETPKEIRLLLMAAPVAFGVVFFLFHFKGYAVDIPGRQIQRPFAVVAPLFAALWLRDAWLDFLRPWGRVPRAGIILGTVWLLWIAPPSPGFTYPDEGVMRTIRSLPVDSLVMAYPRTADFILVMAGRSTSMPLEILREAVEPASAQAIRQHHREMEVYYAGGPEKVLGWCGKDPGRRFILVERKKFEPEAVSRLLWPENEIVEARRSEGFFLENPPPSCRKDLNPDTFLVPCSTLAGCLDCEPAPDKARWP